MPYLEMPNLDKLYGKSHLRNSETGIYNGRPVEFDTPFYSFYDLKREVRGLILVPAIAAFQVLEHALHALEDLVVAAVLLATLDGKGFERLGYFFAHAANAISLAAQGIYDTAATVFALFTRSVSTFFNTIGFVLETMFDTVALVLETMFNGVASVFENEPAQQQQRRQVYPSTDASAGQYIYTQDIRRAANLPYIEVQADLARINVSPLRANSMFPTPVTAPAPKPTLSQAKRDIEALEGVSDAQRQLMLADLDVQLSKGDVVNDEPYQGYYRGY